MIDAHARCENPDTMCRMCAAEYLDQAEQYQREAYAKFSYIEREQETDDWWANVYDEYEVYA